MNTPIADTDQRAARRRKIRLAVRLAYPFFIFLAVLLLSAARALIPPRPPPGPRPAALGLPAEEVSFAAPGGPTLRGWLIGSPEAAATVIGLHGYPADKSDVLPFLAFLHPRFNLLLFDFRAMGESDGLLTSLGRAEIDDTLAAIEFIDRHPLTAGQPVGLWGYSLGGAVAIMAAAGNDRVTAVVTDSAFASLEDMIGAYYPLPGLLGHAFTAGAGWLARRLRLGGPGPEQAVGHLRAPLLLIHARRDTLVPATHARRLQRRAGGAVRLHLTAAEGHFAGGGSTYEALVADFFSTHLHEETRNMVK